MGRVDNCRAGMPGLNLPRPIGNFFFFKKLRDFMRVRE